jgi:transcription elongation factor Elf1
MDNKKLYIEPLIKLIELNEDKSWLDAFLGLRTGGYLPGGGAGSLNDWGPCYSDKVKSSWYSNLYIILRHLFDNNLQAEQISEFKSVKFRNNIRVIRCLNCNKSYQHPSVFESHIALDFFNNNFIELAENQKLLNLFIPEKTYENQKTIDFKNWLTGQYESNNIKIYDFVNNKYICPHCGKEHGETEYDLYIIKNEGVDNMVFQQIKQNANWEDFEKIPAGNNTLPKAGRSWWQKLLSSE